jgi:hypothetical protein
MGSMERGNKQTINKRNILIMETTISFAALSWHFPDDTIWRASGAEICGYSQKKQQYIVIDDGTCVSPTGDGKWLCHVWKVSGDFVFGDKFCQGEKLREEWLSFIPDTDVKAVCQYRCGKVGER